VPVSISATGGNGTTYTYALQIDGAAVTVSGPSYSWDTTKVANGTHTLTATATDSRGQSGTATSTVTVSNGTTTPPPSGTLKLAVTQPKPTTTVSGTAWAVMWLEGSTSTSNTYSLTLGGKPMGSLTTASRGPVSVPYDTRMVADGTQALVASVKDMTGKVGTTSVNVVTSNGVTTPPPPAPGALTASFTSPAAGATVSGTSSVGMSVAGSTAVSRTFRLSVDGTVVSTQTVSGTTAFHPWNTSALGNGAHTLSLTVTDALGRSATASRSVTISNTSTPPPPPPTTGALRVAITQPKVATTVRGTAWAVMWVEGQSGTSNTFSLFANGRLVASQVTASRGPISLPWVTTAGPNGVVTLQGTVRDATGKTGSTTVNVTVAN
jgi:large repetitive protein